jgi:predicted lipoprotein
MDTLQKQLNILSAKVDGLYQLIEQVSDRVSDIVSECKLGADQASHSETEPAMNYRSYKGVSSLDSSLEHKDVLVDGDSLDAALQSSDKKLTPEIQIQRLTAQLTAAYSRIAALEEQLISQRIHY